MTRRISLLVALVVALFVGVVPLRACNAGDEGGRGVVTIGDHAHSGHGCADHEHATGAQGHHDDDGCPVTHHDDGGCPVNHHDDAECCLDTPFDTSFAVHAVSADRAIDAANAVCVTPQADASSVLARMIEAVAGAPPTPPAFRPLLSLGLASTVLLR